MEYEKIKQQLISDPIAAKRTIERIRIHDHTLSPDFLLLFPGGSIEDQNALITKYNEEVDPIDFWKEVLK